MNTLNWRTVREIQLVGPTIPDPDSPSQLLPKLQNVRVAFDGGLVHIDPRKADQPDHDQGNPEFPVYVVAPNAVLLIHYMEPKPKSSRMTVLH